MPFSAVQRNRPKPEYGSRVKPQPWHIFSPLELKRSYTLPSTEIKCNSSQIPLTLVDIIKAD